MSKKDSAFQKVFMSFMFRGKEIFKPLNTGWIDERVGAVREWVANVFFYRKNGTTLLSKKLIERKIIAKKTMSRVVNIFLKINTDYM